MQKPSDKLKASQLANILNVTTRAVRKMAIAGHIPAKTINRRGDRLFSVHELLSSVCDIANYGTKSDLNGVTLFRVYG